MKRHNLSGSAPQKLSWINISTLVLTTWQRSKQAIVCCRSAFHPIYTLVLAILKFVRSTFYNNLAKRLSLLAWSRSFSTHGSKITKGCFSFRLFTQCKRPCEAIQGDCFSKRKRIGWHADINCLFFGDWRASYPSTTNHSASLPSKTLCE